MSSRESLKDVEIICKCQSCLAGQCKRCWARKCERCLVICTVVQTDSFPARQSESSPVGECDRYERCLAGKCERFQAGKCDRCLARECERCLNDECESCLAGKGARCLYPIFKFPISILQVAETPPRAAGSMAALTYIVTFLLQLFLHPSLFLSISVFNLFLVWQI